MNHLYYGDNLGVLRGSIAWLVRGKLKINPVVSIRRLKVHFDCFAITSMNSV
jgi:hypothetical protein